MKHSHIIAAQGSADPNLKDSEGRTVLHLAASTGKLTLAKMLIKAGADLEVKDRWGITPKGWAQRSNFPPLVDLFENGGNTVPIPRRILQSSD